MPGLITVGERSVPFYGDVTVTNVDSVNVDRGDLYDLGFTVEQINKHGLILIAASQPTVVTLMRQKVSFLITLKDWQSRDFALKLLSNHTGVEGDFNETYLDSLVAAGIVLETTNGRYRTNPAHRSKTH